MVREGVIAKMPDISSVGHGSVGPMDRAVGASSSFRTGASSVNRVIEQLGDRVELSQQSRLLDLLRQLPDVRHDRIEIIRTAIAEGSYATDKKLSMAIDSLLDDLREQDEPYAF